MLEIQVNVRIEGEASCEGPLFISGNMPELGDWNPRKIRLERVGDDCYQYNFWVEAGTLVEFKITRGSWQRQGIYGEPFDSFPPSNIVFIAEDSEIIDLTVVNWYNQIPVRSDPVIGDLVIHRGFKSRWLRYSRRLFVWLPPSYGKSTKRFPVLYMHDGQNLFDSKTSFSIHDWKVDEVATKLMKQNKIKEFIVVGIGNSKDRDEEYNLFCPLGKAYAKFMISELKPFIDRKYRTLADASNTAIMGSSSGGMISFQMAWTYPEVFSMAGCLSPAFFVSKSQIYKVIKSDPRPLKPVKFYLDAGEFEPEFAAEADKMKSRLLQIGYREGHNLLTSFGKKQNHSEEAWAKRVHVPLKFFFAK